MSVLKVKHGGVFVPISIGKEGPPGPEGPEGPQGPVGPSNLTRLVYREAATRTNLLANPSAEVDTSSWIVEDNGGVPSGTIASSPLYAHSGVKSLECTLTDDWIGLESPLISATPGDYALQMHVYIPFVPPDYWSLTMRARFRDTGGVSLGTMSEFVDMGAVPVNEWAPVTCLGTAPANTVTAEIYLYAEFYSTTGQKVYMDSFLFERASEIDAYFDGDTVDSTDWTYDWSGTAHASTSIATAVVGYPDRPAGVKYVDWLGPVAPTSPLDGDTWTDTTVI